MISIHWSLLLLAAGFNALLAAVLVGLANRGVFQLWQAEGITKAGGLTIDEIAVAAIETKAHKVYIATDVGMKLATSLYVAKLGDSRVVIIEPEETDGHV